MGQFGFETHPPSILGRPHVRSRADLLLLWRVHLQMKKPVSAVRAPARRPRVFVGPERGVGRDPHRLVGPGPRRRLWSDNCRRNAYRRDSERANASH
jgi:hypothetical protein